MNTPGQILKFLVHEISIVDEGANKFSFLSYKSKGANSLMRKFAVSALVLSQLMKAGMDMEKIQKSIPDDIELDPTQLSQPNAPEPQATTKSTDDVELTEQEEKARDLMIASVQMEQALKAYAGNGEQTNENMLKSFMDFMKGALGVKAEKSADATDSTETEPTQQNEVPEAIQKQFDGINTTLEAMGQVLKSLAGGDTQDSQDDQEGQADDPQGDETEQQTDKSKDGEGTPPEASAEPSDDSEGEQSSGPVNKNLMRDYSHLDADQRMEKRREMVSEMDTVSLMNHILTEVGVDQVEPVNKSTDSQDLELNSKIAEMESKLTDLKKLRRGSSQPVAEDDPIKALLQEHNKHTGGELGGGTLGNFARDLVDRHGLLNI